MSTNSDLPQLCFTVTEAMEILHCGRTSLYARINGGVLRSFKVGGRRYISREAIEEYIAEMEARSQAGAGGHAPTKKRYLKWD